MRAGKLTCKSLVPSDAVINFCQMQTLNVLERIFKWKLGLWAFLAYANVWHHLFSYNSEYYNNFSLIRGPCLELNSKLHGIERIVAGKVLKNSAI